MSKKGGCNASWQGWYRQTKNIREQFAVIEILTQVVPAAPKDKGYILLRNGDEITSTNRRTDLGQVCSI